MMADQPRKERILLTGATGYVGGRLLRLLEERGFLVRCFARNPEPLLARVGPNTEVVQGDVFDAAALRSAMAGVAVAFYLIHSMGSRGRFDEEDRLAARSFAEAARDAGVGRMFIWAGWGEAITCPRI